MISEYIYKYINYLFYKYFNKFPKPKKVTKRLTINQIKNILIDGLNIKKNIFLSDKSYGLCTKKEFLNWLRINKVNLRLYRVIKHDCDDYSYELMGQASEWNSDIAFGIVWVNTGKGHHGLNLLIDNEEKIWFVEPQNDKMFFKPKKWEVELIVM